MLETLPEAVFARHGDGMTEAVRPYVVALADGHQPIGTALFVRQRDRYFLFTAGHVVEECRRCLEQGSLAIWGRTGGGAFSVHRGTTLLGHYDPEATPYFDAGVVVLNERDAKAIPAWANNCWWTLSDSIELDGAARDAATDGDRLYFATGIVPGGPNVKRMIAPGRTAYKYVVVAFKRHRDGFHRGALKFGCEDNWTEIMNVNELGEHLSLREEPMQRFSLSGLSGSPVWTFDSSRHGETDRVGLRLVALHSGTGDGALVAVPVEQHFRLMAAHGLLYV